MCVLISAFVINSCGLEFCYSIIVFLNSQNNYLKIDLDSITVNPVHLSKVQKSPKTF